MHYQDQGFDSRQGVEISGPAGLDVTGVSIILYDAIGGVQYNAFSFSGPLTNAFQGYGFLAIQNIAVSWRRMPLPSFSSFVTGAPSMPQTDLQPTRRVWMLV